MSPAGALLLLACRRPVEVAPPPLPAPAPAAPAAPVPAGRVEDGRYVDARMGFSAPLPEGWSATPGVEGFALRVVFTDDVSGARVEVWAYEEAGVSLRPREGCTWTFEDEGPYASLRARGEVHVATCRPEDPRDPNVLGTYISKENKVWHVEALLLQGSLGLAAERVDALLWGMRFE